jgi:hypothetical protein
MKTDIHTFQHLDFDLNLASLLGCFIEQNLRRPFNRRLLPSISSSHYTIANGSGFMLIPLKTVFAARRIQICKNTAEQHTATSRISYVALFLTMSPLTSCSIIGTAFSLGTGSCSSASFRCDDTNTITLYSGAWSAV